MTQIMPPVFPFLRLAPPLVLGWLALVALMVLVLWWVWNITMPQVFNLPRLGFWQAFRLVVIAAVLFGGVHVGLP